MFVRNISYTCLVVGSLSSCYIDSTKADKDDEKKKNGRKDELTLTPGAGECRYTLNTGCFEGELPAAPGVRVAGKDFFDVENLRERFYEDLLQERIKMSPAKVAPNKKVVSENVEFRWVTTLRNDTFAQDMQVYLKGEDSRFQQSFAGTEFKLNNLPEGTYAVRVQKPIRFQLVRTMEVEDIVQAEEPAPAPNNAPANPEDPKGTSKPAKLATTAAPTVKTETVVYEFCASLFAQQSFDVQARERSRFVFDSYELFVNEKECKTDTVGRGEIRL